MQKAVPVGIGAMAAILGLDDSLIQELCNEATEKSRKSVEPANFNSPGQVVISGYSEAVQKVSVILKSDTKFKAGKCIPLTVSAPFHCSLMQPALDAMKPLIEKVQMLAPSVPLIQNADAGVHRDLAVIRKNLINQITKPVLWTQSMMRLTELGASTVLELGPGKVLCGLQKRINREINALSISNMESMKEILK